MRQALASFAVVCLILGTGCTLYQPRPVTYKVRDGDTGGPIEGAEIKATYLTMLDFGVLFASIGPLEGKTDRDGNLTLIIDPDKSSCYLSVTAEGYPKGSGPSTLSPRFWARKVPKPWYSWREEYEVELYKEPEPVADVILPTGYRGVVVVKFSAASKRPSTPGQRSFPYSAHPNGHVEIQESALFEHPQMFNTIHGRYADGTKLKTIITSAYGPEPIDEVALRFITPEWGEHVWLYVVGTAAEAEAVKRSVGPDDNRFDEKVFKKLVEAR